MGASRSVAFLLVWVAAVPCTPSEGSERPVLAVELAVPAGPASVGQPVTVTLSIANTGSVTLFGVSSELSMAGGAGAIVVAVPESSVRPSIGPGEEVVTGWGIVAISSGSLDLTATVSGTWVAEGRTVTGSVAASARMHVQAPPLLEVAWEGPPEGWCARNPFAVSLRVGNSGGADAAGVAPPALEPGGTAAASIVAGPPPGVVTIPGGGAVVFTWTLAGSGGGTLELAATVTGRDAGSGIPVGAVAAGGWVLAAPGELAAWLAVPAEVSRGQWAQVVLTVTNTGGYPVTDIGPVLAGPAGGGRTIREPPSAAGRPLAPGASRRIRWTWSVDGLGDLAFAASVACRTCDGYIGLGVTASATAHAVTPAALSGGLAVSAHRIVSGQKVTVTLAITNTGGAAADRVTALVPVPSTSRSALVSGPVRAILDRLPPGSATAFSWVWSVSATGPVGFSTRAFARDANAEWGLSTGIVDAPPLRVLAPASLKIDRFSIFPGPNVVTGVFVTACLVITNTGETPAQLVGLSLKEKESSSAVLGSPSMFSPVLPCDLPAGDSASVIWSYRTGVWGTATIAAGATAVEPATGRKLTALQAVSNRVTVTAWMAPGGLD